MARGRGSGKKSGPKPTSRARNSKQNIMQRYTKAREDAQLAGLIPTTPEAAIDSERVDPLAQATAALPELVRQALRESWATPDSAKPAIIAALLAPFFREEEIVSQDGTVVKVKPSAKTLMELANTLRMLDQQQYERDHPEAKTPSRSGDTHFHGPVIQNNMDAAALVRRMIEDGQLGLLEELPTSHLAGPPGSGRHEREVEAGPAPEADREHPGEGVADG